MRHSYRMTGLLLLLGLSFLAAREPQTALQDPGDNAVHVSIIYDNYQADKNLGTDWGFACLVECQGNPLLFDAGRNADLYKKNVNLLGIHPEEIPSLFISHEHGDHTAGIPWILELNPSIRCFLPASYAEQLEKRGILPQNSQGLAKPVHLYGPYYSTGDDFAAFREQGLVIKTEKGGVLVTGCSHPGVVPMVQAAVKELGIEIHTVIGGLHLMDKSREEVEQIAADLKKLGVRQICPTHCTGDKSIEVLKSVFGTGYIPGGTGREIIIPYE
jgi:7,8-dihydropterin-6-yl-methyl-4-(beta-D-ribofuranosyl)aminobenzene 5'-phosphate synthase